MEICFRERKNITERGRERERERGRERERERKRARSRKDFIELKFRDVNNIFFYFYFWQTSVNFIIDYSLKDDFWNGTHAIPMQRGMVFTKIIIP